MSCCGLRVCRARRHGQRALVTTRTEGGGALCVEERRYEERSIGERIKKAVISRCGAPRHSHCSPLFLFCSCHPLYTPLTSLADPPRDERTPAPRPCPYSSSVPPPPSRRHGTSTIPVRDRAGLETKVKHGRGAAPSEATLGKLAATMGALVASGRPSGRRSRRQTAPARSTAAGRRRRRPWRRRRQAGGRVWGGAR